MTIEQKQKILKTKVAVAMYDEFHKVPKEEKVKIPAVTILALI